MTDSGVSMVTFLFTDIEGSTRRWEDEPETMATHPTVGFHEVWRSGRVLWGLAFKAIWAS